MRQTMCGISSLLCNAGELASVLGQEDPPGKGKWQPTPVFLPGESHGHRSLVGYSPQGHKELRHDWSDLAGFPGSSDGKASAYNAGGLGSIPGSGRSPGERNGNPLQYSCLENPMDQGAWWATVHRVAKSRTRLSDFNSLHFTSNRV